MQIPTQRPATYVDLVRSLRSPHDAVYIPRRNACVSKAPAVQLRVPIPRKRFYVKDDTAADIDRWVASVIDSDSDPGSDSDSDDELNEDDVPDIKERR
jgi:hypothetical protein